MMISIITILKNDPEIANTLEGLAKQDYKGKYEVIVVDRSTIKYKNLPKLKQLHWVNFDPRNKRFTIPEQRNVGVQESTGNIVVFIDASCVPNNNWLTEITRLIINGDEKIVLGKTGSIGKNDLNDLSYKAMSGKKYLDEAPTINLAISRSVFDKVGLFDENLEYGSDADFTWRACDNGFKIRYQPSAYVVHNWGDGKQEIKRSFLYGRGRTRIILKHWKNRWRNLFGIDVMLLVYPILIMCLPLSIFFPIYLVIFPVLVIKNITEPHPIIIVIKHFVYGAGVISELLSKLKNEVER